MRVGDHTGEELGRGTCQHEVGEARVLLRKVDAVDDAAEVLIEHELDDRLRDAHVGRGDSLQNVFVNTVSGPVDEHFSSC